MRDRRQSRQRENVSPNYYLELAFDWTTGGEKGEKHGRAGEGPGVDGGRGQRSKWDSSGSDNLLFGAATTTWTMEADLYDEDEDDEGPCESLLRHAPEIEAGLWPGWELDRSEAGALLWTTPSGRRYKSTLDGSSHAPYPH